MKIAITGGHISPALAILDELPQNVEVVFFGRKTTFEGDSSASFEYKEITARNIPFVTLPSSRLQRNISRHTLTSLGKLPLSFMACISALKAEKPDVVLSFGGYMGLPLVVAAFVLRIPSVIHEQTMEAGFANKITSRFAKKICISWESSFRFFPRNKVVLTGLPLRKVILQMKRGEEKKRKRPLIYITGGSGGSHAINRLVEKNLTSILALADVTHQTGDSAQFSDFDRLQVLRSSLPESQQKSYELKKFLDTKEAASILLNADLVIGRSGINTVSELSYFRKPSLLIPLVTGQKGEQKKNAEYLRSVGLSETLLQDKTPDSFLLIVKNMLAHLSNYTFSDELLHKRFQHAAKHIVEVVLDVANKKTN